MTAKKRSDSEDDTRPSAGREDDDVAALPKRGSAPGRREGIPNKATSERIERARKSGGMMPAETMIYKMRYWLGRVARASKLLDANEIDDKEAHKLTVEALDKAAEAAKDAAPYYHQRLAAIAHQHQHSIDLTKLTDQELDFLERIAERASATGGSDMGGTGETTH